MPNSNGHAQLVDPTGAPLRRFGYDVVDDSKKRRAPSRVKLISEDKEQTSATRRKLTATGRDVVRNYALAAWMLRQHLNYCSTFQFQAGSGNKKFDQQLEEFIQRWGRPLNFDVAGRHGLRRYMRLTEARRTIDGDVGTLKLSSGRVQAIEEDRIRNPSGTDAPQPTEPEKVTHGIWVTKSGRAKKYALHNRDSKLGGGFEFDRWVPARHMLWHGYFDTGRFDQVRGVGLIAPAIATLQDTYEGLTYATAKAKIAQMFGVKVKQSREREDAAGDTTTEEDDDGNLDKSATEVDFGNPPFVFDLWSDDQEDVEIVESQQPAQQFQDFIKLLIMLVMKCVDLPYSWFDERHSHYSGQRQAWVIYDQSAEQKRADNRDFLDSLIAWRLALAIIDGEIQIPKSVSVSDLKWSLIATALPWLQPHQEVKAEREAVKAGFSSTPRVCRKRDGTDAYELVDEEEKYLEYREQKLGRFLKQVDASRGQNEPAGGAETVEDLESVLDRFELLADRMEALAS